MRRKTIAAWVAGATMVGLCGAVYLSPLYLYWHMTQRYSSIAEANTALTRNPNDARAYRTIALDFWKQTRDESPRATALRQLYTWEQVARCDAGDEMARWYIGIFAAQAGDRERARKIFTGFALHGHPSLRTDARKALQDLGTPLT